MVCRLSLISLVPNNLQTCFYLNIGYDLTVGTFFNVMSTVPTTTSAKDSLRFLSLKSISMGRGARAN
jgi:hypothetical protein